MSFALGAVTDVSPFDVMEIGRCHFFFLYDNLKFFQQIDFCFYADVDCDPPICLLPCGVVGSDHLKFS